MSDISEDTMKKVLEFLVKVHRPEDEQAAEKLRVGLLKWHMEDMEDLIRLCREG